MSISTEEKDRYLREAAIVLAREGFHTDRTHTGGLRVLLDGAPLCEVTESGGITYCNEDIDEPAGQKPRGGGIYRSPFHYTPKDVACEYCQNYVRKHPCRLCECTCLKERIEAGVLELNSFVRDCFAPSMGSQLRKRMRQQFREKKAQFFLSDAHRRRWTHWRERCWRLSDRNKAALFLLTAYESLWRRMVWKCGNDGFDFQSVCLGGIEPELYSVYQAAKAIAVGCCNITLADLASPELVTDEAFHLITGALLMAKYGDVVLNLEKGVDET